MAADQDIARMLGVIPADMDLMETALELIESQVGGYYDPKTDSFSLMDRCPKGVAGIILAHELDHALDDQLFDLDGGLSKASAETDSSLAYSSVVEGSGTSVMNRWMMANMGDIDLGGYQAMEEESRDVMAAAPTWLWKPLVGAYLRGASFLVRSENLMDGQMKAVESSDIRAAFTSPPTSTEQILHPQKYWDPEQRDNPRQVEILEQALPTGWERLREDTLGESMLAIFASPESERGGLDTSNPMAMIATSFTNDAAAGWGGDRLVLLGREDARILHMVTVWDTSKDAGEFYGAMTILLPGLKERANVLDASGDEDRRSGAELAYGASPDEVLITIYSGVPRRDLKKVQRTLAHRVAGN